MRVIHNLDELPESLRASVVTIGNFDGVHRAHQKLLRRVVETAKARIAVATAVTFEPHPSKILAPEDAPKLLTAPEQKGRLIEQTGIDLLLVLPFTKQFSRLSPQEFVRTILVAKLRTVSVHVGPNFRFGYRQSGDIEALAGLARREDFELEVLPTLELRNHRVSSSHIRQLLSEGRVNLAGRLLGRPFSTCGPIVAGHGLGSKQTVPTLNLAPVESHLPKIGVYVTRTRLGDTRHDSVTNVGHKPTFGEHRLTVETFLLNFVGEVKESEMEIEFLYRLRDEMKFPNPAILRAQIQEDARRSLKFFRLRKLLHQRHIDRLAPSRSSEI